MTAFSKEIIMAKYEAELKGSFSEILSDIDDAVIRQSATASLEDGSDFVTGGTRCAVRVYERYSYTGGNRVSMNITLVEADGRIFLSAITSGGSQAMLFKINTLGEESFLELISETINRYRA